LKNTKNNQIYITSLICGLLLGFCLNFMVLQVNRLLNEKEPNIQYHEFEMIGFTNDGFQKWKPINSEDIQFHSEWFGVNAIWKGYVPATIGDVRSFPIIHGFMNDLAVSPTQSKPIKIHNGN
jgi:hypothetical protein